MTDSRAAVEKEKKSYPSLRGAERGALDKVRASEEDMRTQSEKTDSVKISNGKVLAFHNCDRMPE